jgi:hypothetical protein
MQATKKQAARDNPVSKAANLVNPDNRVEEVLQDLSLVEAIQDLNLEEVTQDHNQAEAIKVVQELKRIKTFPAILTWMRILIQNKKGGEVSRFWQII